MGQCAMGTELVAREKCPRCGASDNDTCGRWVFYGGKIVDAALAWDKSRGVAVWPGPIADLVSAIAEYRAASEGKDP